MFFLDFDSGWIEFFLTSDSFWIKFFLDFPPPPPPPACEAPSSPARLTLVPWAAPPLAWGREAGGRGAVGSWGVDPGDTREGEILLKLV